MKVMSRGWGEDSIAQTLPQKQGGPEFNPHNPRQKPGEVIDSCSTSAGEVEAGYLWGSLASQTSRADETPNQLETLSPKQEGWEEGR